MVVSIAPAIVSSPQHSHVDGIFMNQHAQFVELGFLPCLTRYTSLPPKRYDPLFGVTGMTTMRLPFFFASRLILSNEHKLHGRLLMMSLTSFFSSSVHQSHVGSWLIHQLLP